MERIYLNEDWYFSEHFEDSMTDPAAGTAGMRKVRLPHTVRETPFHFFSESLLEMVSCYRRVISIEEAWRSGHILLTFEGAAHEAVVYINGKKAAVHYSGYTAFTIDMIPYLTEGCYFFTECSLHISPVHTEVHMILKLQDLFDKLNAHVYLMHLDDEEAIKERIAGSKLEFAPLYGI